MGSRPLALFVAVALLAAAPAGALDPGAVPPRSGVPQRGLPPPVGAGSGGCVPVTCEQVKATCGMISNGCGEAVDCGVVGAVAVAVVPKAHAGLCPRTFTFTATVTANRKGTVAYEWSNPPFVSAKGQVVFGGPGTQKVVFAWPAPPNLPASSQWLAFSTVDQNGCSGGGPVKTSFSQTCVVPKVPAAGGLAPSVPTP